MGDEQGVVVGACRGGGREPSGCCPQGPMRSRYTLEGPDGPSSQGVEEGPGRCGQGQGQGRMGSALSSAQPGTPTPVGLPQNPPGPPPRL